MHNMPWPRGLVTGQEGTMQHLSNEPTLQTFCRAARIEKRYSNYVGRRFARVRYGAWACDVLVRKGPGQSEETRAQVIKRQAWNRWRAQHDPARL